MYFVPNCLPVFLAYEAEQFPRKIFKTSDMKAKVWWKALNNNEINPEFVQMIVKLFHVL